MNDKEVENLITLYHDKLKYDLQPEYSHIIMAYPKGKEGILHFATGSDREVMIRLLKEVVEKLENKEQL